MPSSSAKSLHLIAPELLPGLQALPTFEYNTATLPAIRAGMDQLTAQFSERCASDTTVCCEEVLIPGAQGDPDVRVLVYTPTNAASAPRPGYLHIHGGGYVLGAPEMNDQSNRTLTLQLDCVVVSVDYRLAPETPFPGARDDCYAALQWFHANADRLNVDNQRIAVGGESAGGGHAAALALYARDRGAPAIAFLLLDAPMLDDRTCATADPHPYCGEFGWTPASNRFGWQSLLGMEPGSAEVPDDAAPARANDLSGLPPTCITVGALDLFLEENLEFARRLTRAGVATELHVIPGAYHGFGVRGPQAPQVRKLTQWRWEALARGLSNNGLNE